MRLKLLNVRQDINEIQDIWLHFLSQCDVSYYLSWGFIENWLITLPENVDLQLAVIYDNNEPIIAFFLGAAKNIKAHVFRSQAFFVNATGIEDIDRITYIQYNTMLLLSSRTPPLVEVLELLPVSWEEVFFPGVQVESYPGRFLFEELKGYDVSFYREFSSPFVDLQMVRDSGGDYISMLSAKRRGQIRRSYRKYQEMGPVELDEAQDPEQGMAIFNEIIALHEDTLRTAGKRRVFATEYSLKFHRRLIEKRFEHGEIQILRVRAGSESIGCLYNYIYNNRIYGYQIGLKYQSDKGLMPGYVSIIESVKHNAKLGHSILDLGAVGGGGGGKFYKNTLSTNENRLVWARVQKPHVKFKLENKLRHMRRDLENWAEQKQHKWILKQLKKNY